MTPDRTQAEGFIAGLTGAPDATVTWQLLSDSRDGRRRSAVYHHPLAAVWRELSWQNSVGVGIFVMVNAGDGGNRASANVVSLRALFVDDDKGLIQLGGSTLAALPPSLIVRSRRGPHLYWRLRDGEALARFSPAQEALAAHFGTDGAVKDLPRVMRVPGFFHMKQPNDPFMVQLVEAAPGRRYSIDEVLGAFPPPAGFSAGARMPRAGRDKGGPHPRRHGRKRMRGEALGVLEQFTNLGVFKWAANQPEDVSREAWRGLATNIAAAVLGDPVAEQAGESFFQGLSLLDAARYSPVDTSRTFKDALKSAADFGPMRYDTLIAAGVPAEVCVGSKVGAAPVAVAKRLFDRERKSRR